MPEAKKSQGVSAKPAPAAPRRAGAAENVALRNRVLYFLYRRLSLIFVCALTLCAISAAGAVFFMARKTPPIYIATSSSWAVLPTPPLNEPSLPPGQMEGTVKQFVYEACKKMFTFDYLNYSEQIQSAAAYFTVRGWNNYLNGLVKSNNLVSVQEFRMITSFTPLGAPEIKETGIRNGRYSWLVHFPAEVKYAPHVPGRQPFVQRGTIKMVVMRISTIDSPRGIGVDQVIFEEAAAPKN